MWITTPAGEHASTACIEAQYTWGPLVLGCLCSIHQLVHLLLRSSIFLHDLLLFVLLQIALFVAAVRDLLPISLLVPPTLLDVGNNRLKRVDWDLLAVS